jgi:uncharacterized protein
MIVRYLLLAAFIYFVYTWLRRAGTRGRAAGAAPQENMVACAHCGVHLPQSDSVSADGRSYCGDEHRVAGPK